MIYTVKKIASDTVALAKDGYMPEVVTVSHLFDKDLYKLNKYGIVNNVYYDEPFIIFDLEDPILKIKYLDAVAFDDSLSSDPDIKMLAEKFASDYLNKKEEINRRNGDNVLTHEFRNSVERCANDAFRTYNLSGNLVSIPSNAHAMRVYNLCKEHSSLVYTESCYDSYLGVGKTKIYESTSTRVLGATSKFAAISSIFLASLAGGFVAGKKYDTGALTIAGSVLSGVSSYVLTRAKDKKIEQRSCEMLDEIALLINEKFEFEKEYEVKKHK